MSDQPQESGSATVSFDHFARLDIRVGTVVSAEPLAGARVPAIGLRIEFGALGTRRSSAQITKRYTAGELIGKQVVCVVNFPPKRIAGFSSEVLVLGAVAAAGDVVLLQPDRAVPDGTRVA